MTSDNDIYKANALRVLSRIVDQSNMQSIDRLLKNALVDKSTHVKTSALVSSIHLLKRNPEMIRKHVGEIQQILLSGNSDLQYHALLLLHELKKVDPMAILKVLSQLTTSQATLGNKLAKCQLIRYIKELLTYANLDPRTMQNFVQYLFETLNKSNDIVTFEAAKALCELSETLKIDLETPFSALMTFIQNGNAVQKFAALKVMNRLAQKHTSMVAMCTEDL